MYNFTELITSNSVIRSAESPFVGACIHLYGFENGISQADAKDIIVRTDAQYQKHYVAMHGSEMGIVENYDLCMNVKICNITKSTMVARDFIMARIMQDCFDNIKD